MDESAYPTSIFCIIATEFCERFSFCGLRTILSLYLRNELLFPENAATVIYHVFIMVCYIIPIFGAICADSFLGRYRTILYFSLIYLVGNILMCLAAIPPLDFSPIFLTVVGLSFIAIGTGGIKPCVAAFGGDQFHLPSQELLLQQFFSIFYFSINLGGFVGMILTPILRKSVTCFGDDTCYALGFGFPAALMFLALMLFVMGKPWYRLKTPKDNVMVQFLKCTIFALSSKCKMKRKKKHWLDYAEGKCGKKVIEDMKIVFAVIFLYTPLPIFWSLFDQQGSRWTFQASRMDGLIMGTQVVPDQMQVVNPAIVLILIPLFDGVLYPCLTKGHHLENPLHRMAIGGIIAGLAFLSAGILELVLEKTYPDLPGKGQSSLNIINTLPCNVNILSPFSKSKTLNSSEFFRFRNFEANNKTQYTIKVRVPQDCSNIFFSEQLYSISVPAIERQIDTMIITHTAADNLKIYLTDPVDFKKSLSGKPRIRIAFIKNTLPLCNVTVSLEGLGGFQDIYFVPQSDTMHVSAYMEVPPGLYKCLVQSKDKKNVIYESTVELSLGGVYTMILVEKDQSVGFSELYIMSPPNKVNILWLIPQYFLISVAEIMFGIAGLEFSFTQAPKSLKTVTIAAWYLSVALGNFLVIIITQLKLFKSQAHEFFLFAVLIVADMMVFMQMAANYEFVTLEADSSTIVVKEEKQRLLK